MDWIVLEKIKDRMAYLRMPLPGRARPYHVVEAGVSIVAKYFLGLMLGGISASLLWEFVR